MILKELVNGLIAAAHSHNHLVILDFDEETLPSVSVYAFLLPHKEKAGLAVRLMRIVNELCELPVSEVISSRLVYEVDPLKIIHVLVHAL